MVQLLRPLENWECDEQNLHTLIDTCDNIFGRSFCALGDGATAPIVSSIQLFREEYVDHVRNRGCPFDPTAATLFAGALSR